jgi:hypothetical protein
MSRIRSDLKIDFDLHHDIVYDIKVEMKIWSRRHKRALVTSVIDLLQLSHKWFTTPPPEGGNNATDARNRAFRHVCISKVCCLLVSGSYSFVIDTEKDSIWPTIYDNGRTDRYGEKYIRKSMELSEVECGDDCICQCYGQSHRCSARINSSVFCRLITPWVDENSPMQRGPLNITIVVSAFSPYGRKAIVTPLTPCFKTCKRLLASRPMKKTCSMKMIKNS